MLLGLAVKEMVIGGLSVLGVGMGTCNSVSLHKTKKRVSSCENAISEIVSMKDSIQRMEATMCSKENQPSSPVKENVKVETVEVEKVEVIDNASTSTK